LHTAVRERPKTSISWSTLLPRTWPASKLALRILEDHAADEVADTDVAPYTIVRLADEIVVDLMALACGIDYKDAAKNATSLTIDGVAIPIASPATLIRTKNTVRIPLAVAWRRFEQTLEQFTDANLAAA
jgi:hypothetical protein